MLASGFVLRDVLRLPGSPAIAWAVFDPDWYLATYPAARQTAPDHSPTGVLHFYIEHGQALGHSPNRYFDEAWHLRRYPRVAEAVRTGRVASGFDAYCREGLHGRSPHWLFDEFFYRTRYADLTEDCLAADGAVNGYDHYLRHGDRVGRSGHPLFDPATYRAQLDPADQRTADAQGCFTHYLRSLSPNQPERRTTLYFDPSWHAAARQRSPATDDPDRWLGALHHYLGNATPTDYDPLPDFSERDYLGRYADAANAVASGRYRNGYAHFLAKGKAELRAPTRQIDLALHAPRAADAFEHHLTFGRSQRSPAAPTNEPAAAEAAAQRLFRLRADTLLPLFGRQMLDFTCREPADLSVLMVLHNQFPLTLMALGSLRENFPGAIELILVDSGSSDETRDIDRYVVGAHVLRFDANIGYLRGCNAALQLTSADVVLYLNNDVLLASDAVGAALRRLRSNPRVGAVGGKVVRCHGVLQEAGCIVWRDGSTSGYLRDQSPLVPEANFVRTVDFCSGVFLMVRGDLVRRLEGFDDSFAPAYYEDADLCVRIAQAGHDVLYDPSVIVFHHEYGSADGAGTPAAHMERNRGVFARKHGAWLRDRPVRDDRRPLPARFADAGAMRVLFIEDTVPLRNIGSGFVRSNDLVQVMASLGYRLTVFPLNGSRFDIANVYRDMPDTVEVMHDSSIDSLAGFLAQREGCFDAVWVARTHNLDGIRPFLDRLLAGTASERPFIVLDTEAIDAMREAGRQALTGEAAADLEAAVRSELKHADICRTIVVVSDAEAAKLRDLGWDSVAVIGHMRTLAPTPRAFAERTGMLFVGAMHREASPNYESLDWFVNKVLPIVEQALGWQTRLTIVGYTAPGVSLERFANHPRVTLRGSIGNIESIYNQHRIFVAPTRYAAGQPYKVYEAASFGVPVVATELLRRQMNWENGQDLMSADGEHPEKFAQQIIALYQDEPLWQRIRAGALDRLRRENNRERYVRAIERILGPADRAHGMPR
ncbi:MAG: glycosyltransferase [Acetobacteraceae bacterium]